MALKIKIFISCLLFFSLNSHAQILTPEEKTIFDDVAYIPRPSGKPTILKWASPIRYRITGEQTDYLLKDANEILNQIASLTGLDIKMATTDEEANFIVELKKEDQKNKMGYGFVYTGNFKHKENEKSEIIRIENSFVVLTSVEKTNVRYLFIRMILKSIGFFNKSNENQYSIFYDRRNNTLKIGKSDAKIVKFFYSPEVKPGMTRAQVDYIYSGN
jgi:hypothetical protein